MISTVGYYIIQKTSWEWVVDTYRYYKYLWRTKGGSKQSGKHHSHTKYTGCMYKGCYK